MRDVWFRLFGQHVVSQAMKSGSTIAITDVTGDGVTDMVGVHDCGRSEATGEPCGY